MQEYSYHEKRNKIMDISSFQQENTAQIIYIDIYVNWKLRL